MFDNFMIFKIEIENNSLSLNNMFNHWVINFYFSILCLKKFKNIKN